VSYEEAFEALKDGDYPTAVALLEKAARETSYSSDIINHAYTLALHNAGDKPRLAEVSFRVANTLLEQDPASAMDYFQRALFAGLDSSHVRRIGQIFEGWAAPERTAPLSKPVNRVAHVLGCLLPDQTATQYLKMLVSSLKSQGIQSTIFTTEWAASWFFSPAGVPQSQSVPIDADVKIASVEGDFVERAERIAEAILDSNIEVAFFYGNLAEQITARVASLRPASIQIGVDCGGEMDADLFNGRIYLFWNALDRTRFSRPAEWIPPASDIESRLQMSEHVTRQSMGLESASSVSATFGDLSNVKGSGYLRVLSEIMQRFPKHFHIFAGAGNVKAVRAHLHSEGVLPRIRFLGQVGDVAHLLPMIDVYLTSFPLGDERFILEAMGAGKPVVVMRFPPDSHYNSGAELVGARELIAPGEADYIEIADRLLRTPKHREAQGQAMLERFRAEFRPERLGERYKNFIEKF
jgi:glycosyltransferase involved in cell wall biosynthesis